MWFRKVWLFRPLLVSKPGHADDSLKPFGINIIGELIFIPGRLFGMVRYFLKC